MPRILVKQNDRVIDQYIVENGTLKVGRTPDNDVVLNDPSVSRSHLELKIDGNKVTISDLGSSNGTYVNGIRINRMISSKAVVGVGVYTLDIVGLGAEHHAPPPPVQNDDVEATMMMPAGLGSASREAPGPGHHHHAAGGGPLNAGPTMEHPRTPSSGGDDEPKKGSWLGRLFGKK
jgi:predicted component of type VI protein secretion system